MRFLFCKTNLKLNNKYDSGKSFINIISFLCSHKIQTMQQAKSGDSVKIHYTGRLTNGETFDSSAGREPLAFTLGSGMVIKGFDDGVTGMITGEKKTITIPPDEAYGLQNLPPEMEVEAGTQLMMNNGQGQQLPVVVIEVKEEVIVIDANHQLAGKELIFDLELVAIDAPKSSIILEP
jgi:peptidylprolyl isomerase